MKDWKETTRDWRLEYWEREREREWDKGERYWEKYEV